MSEETNENNCENEKEYVDWSEVPKNEDKERDKEIYKRGFKKGIKFERERIKNKIRDILDASNEEEEIQHIKNVYEVDISLAETDEEIKAARNKCIQEIERIENYNVGLKILYNDLLNDDINDAYNIMDISSFDFDIIEHQI